jgi:hypothetical protein
MPLLSLGRRRTGYRMILADSARADRPLWVESCHYVPVSDPPHIETGLVQLIPSRSPGCHAERSMDAWRVRYPRMLEHEKTGSRNLSALGFRGSQCKPLAQQRSSTGHSISQSLVRYPFPDSVHRRFDKLTIHSPPPLSYARNHTLIRRQ